MNYDIIGGVIEQKALDQLKEVERIAKSIGESLKGVKLGSVTKSEKEFANLEKINQQTQKLVAATTLLNQKIAEGAERKAKAEQKADEQAVKSFEKRAKLMMQVENENRRRQEMIEKASQAETIASQKSEQQAAKKIGYINELKEQVKLLEQQYYALTKAELEGSQGASNLKNLTDKRAELSKLQQAYGNYGLQVGNYGSATKMLGINIGQVMKEMPNFAISARIGIMSLTNNLPMLAESIKAVRMEQLAMIEAGKKAPSMFSLISKSVFGLTGLMSVLMVLMQIFGADIIKWVGELFKGEKAFRGLTNAELGLIAVQQTLNKSMKDGGGVYSQAITDIEKMTVSLKASKGSKELAKKALDDYNNSLGVTFGKAKNVDDALKLIKDNEKDYIKAMQNMAFANAFFNQSAEDMTKIIKTATADNASILGESSKGYIDKINEWVGVIQNLTKAEIPTDEAERQLKLYSDRYNAAAKKERDRQIAEIKSNQNLSLQQAEKYYKKYAQLYKENDWKFKENEDKSAKDKVEKTADINSVLVDIDAKMYDDLRKNFDEHIKDMLKQMDDNQKFIESYRKLSNSLTDTTFTGWVDQEGNELDNWLENIKKQKDAERKIKEDSDKSIADSSEQLVSDLMDIWALYYDFLNQKIDEQLKKDSEINDEKIKQYEDETDAGMHTQKELSDYKDRISDYQKSQEDEAAKQKAENDRKAFILNQVKTISDIWIAYALNMVKGGLNPLAQSLLLAQAVGGTALVAAQTIPYFAEGGIMEQQGMAVLGDAYKHELAITPSGQYFVSDNKPTMYNLEKGTQILPDINRMDLASVLALKQVMPEMRENVETNAILKSIEKGIKSQKQGNFYGMPLIRQIENRNKYSSRSRSLMN